MQQSISLLCWLNSPLQPNPLGVVQDCLQRLAGDILLWNLVYLSELLVETLVSLQFLLCLLKLLLQPSDDIMSGLLSLIDSQPCLYLLRSNCKLHRRYGLLLVCLFQGAGCDDRCPTISEQRVPKDPRQLGVSKWDVLSSSCQRMNHIPQTREGQVYLLSLLKGLSCGSRSADLLRPCQIYQRELGPLPIPFHQIDEHNSVTSRGMVVGECLRHFPQGMPICDEVNQLVLVIHADLFQPFYIRLLSALFDLQLPTLVREQIL